MNVSPEDRYETEEYLWYDEAGDVAPCGKSRHPAVYFLLDEEENAIKVGSATNVCQRLSDLQVGNPRQMRFVGWIPGGLDQERMIQDSMHEQCIRGEWYRATDDILSLIRSACAANRVRVYAAKSRWVDRVKSAVKDFSTDRPTTDLEATREAAKDWPFDEVLEASLTMARLCQKGQVVP